jgi:hypothetical protein
LGQMGGTIRVMGALHRWMRDGWQRMEEVRVRGSVTWPGGDLGCVSFVRMWRGRRILEGAVVEWVNGRWA